MVSTVRRKQEDRTAATRQALFEATVAVIHEMGYPAASTSLIAERAQVTRGAILHHFGTRAQLIAQTVRWVYETEVDFFQQAPGADGPGGMPIDRWPALVWKAFSKPSGIAVLDILWATRSDPGLAELVLPIQQEIERSGMERMQRRFGGDPAIMQANVRLLVWSIRGLTMGQAFLPDRDDIHPALDLLGLILRRAAPSGSIDDVYRDAD